MSMKNKKAKKSSATEVRVNGKDEDVQSKRMSTNGSGGEANHNNDDDDDDDDDDDEDDENDNNDDKKKKKQRERKDALKAEAEDLGISYAALKAQKKAEKAKRKAKREADRLHDVETEERQEERKRMRKWSQDLGDETGAMTHHNVVAHHKNDQGGRGEEEDDDDATKKRRRTRSMDAAEEQEAQAQLSPDEWRAQNNIVIQGHGEYQHETNFEDPFLRFSDAPFSSAVQKTLTDAGFSHPTPIQSQAWPLGVKGKDMICIAKTGSGKTCGFLLPCFHQFMASVGGNGSRPPPPPPMQRGGRFGRGGRGGRFYGRGPPPEWGIGNGLPVLLVLAPTRELAVQIMDESKKFGRPVGIRSLCCYGGSPKGPQIGSIERGVECLICTPGRLNDLLEMKKVDLSQIKYLVLDEADRMLDMGFEPQIRSILQHVPTERQTMLFSATWPREIQQLAFDFLRNPIQINVGEVDKLVANKDIEQKVIMCQEGEKYANLTQILSDLVQQGDGASDSQSGKQHPKVIVFVAKKVSCSDLANQLWEENFAVDSLHGDRAQWERTQVMNAFKRGTLRMLIATDVAARGLDVKDVAVVVNYDMPVGTNSAEDYVHRIGRTGRAGCKGLAYAFFTPDDNKRASALVDVLREAEQEVPPELQALVRPRHGARFGGGYGRGGYGRGGGRGGRGRGRGYYAGGRGYGRGGGRGGRGRY